MRTRLFAVSLLALSASLSIGPARSGADEPQPAEETEIRVARLVRQLGADSYLLRKQADDELAALGPESRRQLEVAARAEDPEVRLRAMELLRRLQLVDLWAPTIVHCDLQDRPAADALNLLVEQTGNHILRGGAYGPFVDAKVNLNVASGSFWQVLDDACRQSGNTYRPHLDVREPGLVVASGTMGNHPLAYAGPVRAQITAARRTFIEELDYDDLKSDVTHSFQVNMQVLWEDRFQLVAYRTQPELVEAITDTRATLQATQSSATGWNVISGGTRQLAACLRLHPPPVAARKLDRLVIKWGLIAVGDLAAIDVTDLTAKGTYSQDDVELTIEEIKEQSSGRFDVEITVSRNLAVPDPQEVVFQENRLQCFDAHGVALRPQGQTNALTERGAKMKLTFVAESSDSKPKMLRFIYPRLRSQQDLEIVFRDVPLPAGKLD